MDFIVDENDVAQLLVGYLKDLGAYETLSSFQLETGIGHGKMGDELLYIQKLVLQGRWDETNNFLKTLRKEKIELTSKIDCIIARQKFLESLSYQGGGGQRIAFPAWKPSDDRQSEKQNINSSDDIAEKEVIFGQLQGLQALCSTEEFNRLCQLLTLEKLCDSPEYSNWTVSQGRIEAFSQLRHLLSPYLPGVNEPEPGRYNENGLLKTIALSTAFQVSNYNTSNNKASYSTKLGYIAPHSYNHTHAPLPSVKVVNPVTIMKRFDNILQRVTSTVPQHVTQQSSLQVPQQSRPNTATNRAYNNPSPRNSYTNSNNNATVPVNAEPSQRMESNVFNFSGNVTTKWGTGTNDQAHDIPQSVVPRPPVAWVADDAATTAAVEEKIHAAQQLVSPRPSIASHGMIVDTVEPPVKPMPAGLRRKMEAAEQNISNNKSDEDVSPQNLQQARQLHSQQRSGSNNRPAPSQRHAAVDSDGEQSRPQSKQQSNRNVTQYDQQESAEEKYNYSRPVSHQQAERHHPSETTNNNVNYQQGNSNSSVHSGSTATTTTTQGQRTQGQGERQGESSRPVPPPKSSSRDVSREGNAIQSSQQQRQPQLHVAQQPQQQFPDIRTAVQANDSSQKPSRLQQPSQTASVTSKTSTTASTTVTNASTVNGGVSAGSSNTGRANRVARKYLIYQPSNNTPIRCVSFLEQSIATSNIAIGTNDKSIHILNYNRTAIQTEFQGGPPSNLYDAQHFVTLQRSMVNIHKGSVYSMDVQNNMHITVSGSNDKFLKICSTETGEILNTLRGHTGTIRVVKIQPYSRTVSRTNHDDVSVLVASAGAGDNCPRVWDVMTGDLISVLSAHPSAVHALVWVSPIIVMTGCEAGIIVGSDIHSGDVLYTFDLTNKVRARESDLRLNVSREDVEAKRGICALTLLEGKMALKGEQQGNSPRVGNSIPVIAGCESGFVTMFDAYSGRILFNERLHKEDIRSVTVNDIGSIILTSSYDTTAILWGVGWNKHNSVFELSPLVRLESGHDDKILNAILIPNSNDVITTGADGRVVLWTM